VKTAAHEPAAEAEPQPHSDRKAPRRASTSAKETRAKSRSKG
jgi:hypothetical protein